MFALAIQAQKIADIKGVFGIFWKPFVTVKKEDM